jgi:hypothetical protein
VFDLEARYLGKVKILIYHTQVVMHLISISGIRQQLSLPEILLN